MKKLLTTILFILYFIASSGATIRLHYCGGKVVEWGLGKSKSNDDKCPGCGMKDKKGCCHDKETTIKISNNYQQSISNFQISTPQFTLSDFLLKEDITLINVLPEPANIQLNFSPQATPLLYLSNCVFRI